MVGEVVCAFFVYSLFLHLQSSTQIIFSAVVKRKIAVSLAFRHKDIVLALLRIRDTVTKEQQMYGTQMVRMRLTFVCVCVCEWICCFNSTITQHGWVGRCENL